MMCWTCDALCDEGTIWCSKVSYVYEGVVNGGLWKRTSCFGGKGGGDRNDEDVYPIRLACKL